MLHSSHELQQCFAASVSGEAQANERMLRFVRESMEKEYPFEKNQHLPEDVKSAIEWVSQRSPEQAPPTSLVFILLVALPPAPTLAR